MSRFADTFMAETTPEVWDEDYVVPKEKSLKQSFGTYTEFIDKDGQERSVRGIGTRLERYNVESQDYNGYDK